MAESNSITNFGELAKPATVLIEKIADAVGGVFKPYQIKRIAKAEAEATLIRTESEIQITDLHRRAMHRFVSEEAKKQENIEAITAKALPQLEDKSHPQDMDDDWITNFFDKCRIVSDDDMQKLWARVLAGEANAPGTYSKRTVSFIGSLDKEDAVLFSKLCGFGWMVGDIVPLVFDAQDPTYVERGITFDTLTHLDNIGLVTFQNLAGYQRLRLPRRVGVHYYGQTFILEFQKDNDNSLTIGRLILTKAGQQLAPICGSIPVPGFVDYVLKHWSDAGYAVASPYPRVVPSGR